MRKKLNLGTAVGIGAAVGVVTFNVTDRDEAHPDRFHRRPYRITVGR